MRPEGSKLMTLPIEFLEPWGVTTMVEKYIKHQRGERNDLQRQLDGLMMVKQERG